ncbi:MAG: hypothetical protein ABI758_05405 [Candidatus Woesebacteria bacterium]
MYESINFLRERVRLQEGVLQSDRRIALFTMIGLGLFITLVVAVVGYSLLLQSQLTALNQSVETLKAKRLTLKSIESEYVLRKTMLKLADTVIGKRTKAWDAITYLYSIIPKESQIEAINLSGVDGSLAFTVKSPNVFAFRDLSKTLQSDTVKSGGYQPTLGSLQRNEDGSYDLEVKLSITVAKATPVPTDGTEAPVVSPAP